MTMCPGGVGMTGPLSTPTLYAHSGRPGDYTSWEPLPHHLGEVADRAEGFGRVFGMAAVARAMGALHDIGKAGAAYQAYIRGLGPSPDHSTAGAVIACQDPLYGPRWGKLMAFGIAGHHAGLANGAGGGGMTPLMARLTGYADALPDLSLGVPPPDPAEVRQSLKSYDAFGKALLTRMLFSCLIDADRLATEAFHARLNQVPVDRGCVVDLDLLHDRLAAHLARKTAEADAASQRDPALRPVNDARARVLDTVLQRAALPPGLFSLTVPTGGGKTLASLAFALRHALTHGLRRVIYVIPFTSIVEQTADVFWQALGASLIGAYEGRGEISPGVLQRLPVALRGGDGAAGNREFNIETVRGTR